jgi:AcrR family transcriptional regulator
LSGNAEGSKEEDGREFPRPPLPRGRHRHSPEEIAEDQRQRLLAAMAESVAARGYAATSVARVIELAGVSRATFYELFDNRLKCLLAAYEAIFERFLGEVTAACSNQAAWHDGAAAAVSAAVEFAVRHPEEARLLALDTIAADAEAARCALTGAERLAAMLRTGRDHHARASDLPEVTEQALVGAVAGVVNWHLLSGESLDGLERQLVQLVLTPYLGPAAAARQAAKAERSLPAPEG